MDTFKYRYKTGMEKPKDYFSHKAQDYDRLKSRTQNVENIGAGIVRAISLTKSMHIMDFGSGTGLLLANVAPHVGKITAVDVSSSMNEVLRAKMDQIDCDLALKELDLTKETINNQFHGIISSMTIHHIEDVEAIFSKFYSLVSDGGFVAIADLDAEDGSFHTSDTGVFHLGFDRKEFVAIAENAGFKNVKIETVSTAEKPTGSYPIFLLTAQK